jgi:hypothetical protein
MAPDLVERCFFKSDCRRKLISFSSNSVVCDKRPSGAKQWIAGGEEGNPGCVLTIRFIGVTCGDKGIK